MDKVEQLNNFLQRVTSNTSLSTMHISVCTALAVAWINNGFHNPFNISRSRLMAAARIKSKTTYHKLVTELVAFNYLSYKPSYHPKKGSEVFIIP